MERIVDTCSRRGALLVLVALALLAAIAGGRLPDGGVDVSEPVAIVADPRIGQIRLADGETLAEAWRAATVLDVRWEGDRPAVTMSGSHEGLVSRRDERLLRRLEALLAGVAAEPGDAPRIDTLVFTPSAASATAHHAVSRIHAFGHERPSRARGEVEATDRTDPGSAYYGGLRRVVYSPAVSDAALRLLRATHGTRVSAVDAYPMKVLRHELEHGASTGPRHAEWLEEATAETLPQWTGRARAALGSAELRLEAEEPRYSSGYDGWALLLQDMLRGCDVDMAIASDHHAAARLLRTGPGTMQERLAECLAMRPGVTADAFELTELVTAAGDSPADEARLRRAARLPRR